MEVAYLDKYIHPVQVLFEHEKHKYLVTQSRVATESCGFEELYLFLVEESQVKFLESVSPIKVPQTDLWIKAVSQIKTFSAADLPQLLVKIKEARALAEALNKPDKRTRSRNLSLAITHLEDAEMRGEKATWEAGMSLQTSPTTDSSSPLPLSPPQLTDERSA